MHCRMALVIVRNKWIVLAREKEYSLGKHCSAYMYNAMNLFLAANAY